MSQTTLLFTMALSLPDLLKQKLLVDVDIRYHRVVLSG
jgi:hypothetical protein